jgi:hypothetical protein
MLNIPMAMAPMSNLLRINFLLVLVKVQMREYTDSSGSPPNTACGSSRRSLTVHA